MRRLMLRCATAVAFGAVIGCEDLVTPIGDPVNLSFAPCVGAPDNPTWFAFQDGDGAWQRVTESASGSFDFSIASGRGGIAMYIPGGDDPELFVVYATTEEFQSELPSCNSSVRSVSGTLTGYATDESVQVSMGTSSDVIFGSAAPPQAFLLASVDGNASDLVAVRYRTTSGGGSAFEAFPNNIFIRRNVTGSTTPIVDFSSATEAGAPLQRDLNVTNIVSGEALQVFSNLGLPSTLANIAVYEASAALVSGSVLAHFYGVPGTRLNAGEAHMVVVGATKTVGSGDERRFMTFVFTNPSDQSVTLGPSLGPVTLTGGSRPSASYNIQTAYDRMFDVVFNQGNGSSFRQVEVLATSAYLDGATSVTLEVPNLAGVSGFQSSWLLVPGVSSGWTFLATDASLAVLNSRPITYQGADRFGLFTP